ncbi:TetR/AcrR family transcriptional regulator [Kineococcus sp. SYSU DK018]|uniref:TetR/AcrR family transcriptional regulator n=1 Tax=Kineococcus sp. SYSU DK018 TaxID=3383139 RepID=UPI003D7CD87F
MKQDRRELIARTALQVLASGGARALTHRAVDTRAALPAGSTSYYFRSRTALLRACVDDLAAQDHAQLDLVAPLLAAADAETLGKVLADVLLRWLSTDRERHIARYELSLETLRRPELAEALHRSGTAIRGRVADVLAGLGASDPSGQAQWLVACLDGILFDRLVGANAGAAVDREEIAAAMRRLTALVLEPA